MSKKMRPQLTPKIMLYALFDVLGMIILATGGAWFSTGKDLFIPNFPTNAFQAILAILAGAALMVWAAAQVLREMLKRTPTDNEPGN
jgi:membrane protein implicated in regulation of membrane protease activity